MRFRKPLAAAATVGLTIGAFGVLTPAGAGAAQNVRMTCIGDDTVLQGNLAGQETTSQEVVNLLGTLAGTGATSIPLTVAVTPDVPTDLLPGETDTASFDLTTKLSDETLAAAASAGITAITVKNQKYGILFTGADPTTPGVTATPPETTIDITASPVVYPVATLSGNVTAVDPADPADITNILYQVGVIQLGVSVTISLGQIDFGLNCAVTPETPPQTNVVASTAVEGGVNPSTTTSSIVVPPTTSTVATTTSEIEAAATTPSYTG